MVVLISPSRRRVNRPYEAGELHGRMHNNSIEVSELKSAPLSPKAFALSSEHGFSGLRFLLEPQTTDYAFPR
jgi:hypothetical protein